MGMKQALTTRTFRATDRGDVPLSWSVNCDKCGTSTALEETPGDAADLARKSGFKTKVEGTKPAQWFCKSCHSAGQPRETQ